MMVKVGVFWVAALLDVDIIFDIEEYPDGYQSEEMLLTYSKQHKDVWEKLTKEQCDGKYSSYKFDTLPRGRVCYDMEEKAYKIVFYRGSKEFVDTVGFNIKQLFGIEERENCFIRK
ncbi:MAG: hypothetical protein J6V66_06945 [Clostridia bacterium]|nr:hypothetical protein [Clostridia bacterium]